MKIKPSTLLGKVLRRADVQTFIINLNTEDQLKTKNENSLGVKLYQIGGEYSVETLIIKGRTLTKTKKHTGAAPRHKDSNKNPKSIFGGKKAPSRTRVGTQGLDSDLYSRG